MMWSTGNVDPSFDIDLRSRSVAGTVTGVGNGPYALVTVNR